MSKKNMEKRLQQQNSVQQSAVGGQIAQENKSRWKLIGTLLVIIIIPVITYLNALSGRFHFDDTNMIVENPNIKSFEKAFEIKTRFITDVSLAIDYRLGGLDVRYYHAHAILLHALNCILIFFISRLTLQKLNIQNSFISFAIALLFAVHPLNTEAINYLTQRSMVLGTFFYLASLLSFIVAFHSPSFTSKFLSGMCCLSTFILAIFTKETFASLPITLAFYYIYFLKSPSVSIFALLKKYYIGVLVIIGILVGYMAYLGLFRAITEQARGNILATLLYNWLIQINVAFKYLSLAILPLPYRLNVDHYYSRAILFAITDVVAIIGIIALMFVTVITYKSHRFFSFSVLWMFITHAPTSLIPRGEILVEYRNYLPLVGFLGAVVYLLSKGFEKAKLAKAQKPFIILISIALMFFTMWRNEAWQNEFTLWSDCVEKAPDNSRAHSTLAIIYADKGNFDEAITHSRKAIASSDDKESTLHAYLTMGYAYYKKGDFKEAEESLKVGAREDVREDFRGRFYYVIGMLYTDNSQYDKAKESFDKAIKATPHLSDIYNYYGFMYIKMGKYKEAKEQLEKALAINPEDGRAYQLLKEIESKSK